MPEREFNTIFSERLRYYLKKSKMTQRELSQKLGVGSTSLYNWCKGLKTPRIDKIDAMCKLFNCSRSDLISEYNGGFIDNDLLAIIKQLDNTDELRELLEAVKDISADDMKAIIDIVKRFKKNNVY